MSKIGEDEIKAAFLNRLRIDKRISEDTLVASEFRLGYEGVRADIAMHGPKFLGVEIKSELDTVRRLPEQVRTYERFFDTTIVVLASKHFNMDVWSLVGNSEVWEVTQRGALKRRRAQKKSQALRPSELKVLLTKSETQRVLIRSTLDKADLMIEPSDQDALVKEAFRIAFSNRFGETSRLFWKSVRGRDVEESDLRALSRFAAIREASVQAQVHTQSVSEQWQALAEANRLRNIAA